MRARFRGPSLTMDAADVPFPGGELSGLTVSRGGPPVFNSQRIVAILPGSAASYYLIGRGDHTAELWFIDANSGRRSGSDNGVDPADEDAIQERLNAADRAFVRQPTADAGRALGRAAREHDTSRLRAFNAASRRRYG